MSIHTTIMTMLNQISFEMQSALEHFNEHRNTLKMTTGSAELDSLIDGIQEGIFYLFYGSTNNNNNKNHVVLDAMVYRLLINCVLPIKQKHGYESMGVCFNNIDYYGQRNIGTTGGANGALSPEKIGIAAKCSGIDPKFVFKNLYVHPAYSEQHQLMVAEKVADLIESNKDIKLLVVNNLTKFFKESKSKDRMETANILKQVIGTLCKTCAKNKVALVCTGDANPTARGIIPRPIGGVYLKHAANVIVYFKEFSTASTTTIPSFKATLIKHQYSKTPKSTTVYVRKSGGMMLLD